MKTDASVRRLSSLIDVVAGLLVASSLGLWILSNVTAAATNADALLLPALAQDLVIEGPKVLHGWHYASSPFVFPDFLGFALSWLVTRRFDEAINGYAALQGLLTVLAVWFVFRPRRDASFAVFSVAFAVGGVLLTAVACLFGTSAILYGGWQVFVALSVHHYGNCINSVLALAVYLWWRRDPTWRRLGVLALVVFLFVGSDLLFLTSFPAAIVVADYWVEGGSPFRWLRRRWTVFLALLLPSLLVMVVDAAVNPLSPLKPGGPPPSIKPAEALRIFLNVRFQSGWQTTETAIRALLLVLLVVLAVRARRRAKADGDARAERIALSLAYLVLGVLTSVGAAIITCKYTEAALERYICPLGFFPVYGALGLLAALVADRAPRRNEVSAGVGLVGLGSLAFAHSRTRYDEIAPYAKCAEDLGLDHTAGIAPYWLAKPLMVFTGRRIQAIQTDGQGDPYGNVTNDQWVSQDWFGGGTEPNIRFALMAADELHSEMADGRTPFKNDGNDLNPAVIRERFAPPDQILHCSGGTFWIFKEGAMKGRAPFANGGWLSFPMHIRATHPQLPHPDSVVEADHLRVIRNGTAVFGPMFTLDRGDYRVTWYGHPLGTQGRIHFDILADGVLQPGSDRVLPLASIDPAKAELVSIDFHLEKKTRPMDFRVFADDGALFTLDELVVERK